jgi:hypothetical protein
VAIDCVVAAGSIASRGVQTQVMALDAAGGKGEVLALTVAGEPDVRVGEPVAVEGLIAMP